MKYILTLLCFALLFGCQKETSFEQPKPYIEQPADQGRDYVFPVNIYLGEDITLYRQFSCTLNKEFTYFPSCIDITQNPPFGKNLYQIAGPNMANIEWTTSRPYISGMTYGNYRFVGYAWLQGYGCDGYVSQYDYDTINITVKRRKK